GHALLCPDPGERPPLTDSAVAGGPHGNDRDGVGRLADEQKGRGRAAACTRDADDEVASWIAAGTPPICFGFGSMPVESPAETVEMIGSACAELGERALICAGWSDFSDPPPSDKANGV